MINLFPRWLFLLAGSDFGRISGFCHQIVVGFLALVNSQKENPSQVGNLLLNHEDFLIKSCN